MASRFAPARRRPGRYQPRPAKAPASRPAPPPAALVDAVLRYHDEEHDQGGGRTLLRLSERRLSEVAQTLGDLAPRAARVAILWNEREGEILRVLEAA